MVTTTKGKERNEVVVGAFVIMGFILLTLVVFFVSGVYLFRPGFTLNIMYGYVSILDRGAPVRMAGVRVGEVSKVDLVSDEATRKTRVKVKLFIEKGVEIRENYVFKIQGTHILSEPHIEITPQPGNFPLVKNNALIEGITPIAVESLLEKANEISEKISEILSNFQSAIQSEEGGNALKELVVNLASLTQSLDKALSGSEDEMKQTFANINASTESLNKILDHVESGEGTAGQLLMKDELYKEIREFVREIKTHPWKLLKREGGRKKFLWIF